MTEKHQTVNIMGAYDVWQVVIFFFSWSFFLTYKYLRSSLKACLQNIMSSNIDLFTYCLTNLSFTQAFMLLLMLEHNCKIQNGTSNLRHNPSQNISYMFLKKVFMLNTTNLKIILHKKIILCFVKMDIVRHNFFMDFVKFTQP